MPVTVVATDGTVEKIATGVKINQGGAAIAVLDANGAVLGYWASCLSAIIDGAVVSTPSPGPPAK